MSFKQFLSEELDAKGVAAEVLRALKGDGSQQGPEDWGKEGWYVGVRDWGTWESDYENHDPDDEDGWDEDDDHQVLSPSSRKDLRTIIAAQQAKYPKFTISAGMGEKNWIEITVKAKA
jgi:hypothetical protein